MEYIELYCVEEQPGGYVEIVIARLADMGYEAFEETENGVKAYIQKKIFKDDYLSAFDDLAANGARLTFSHQEIPFQNWNSVWESNFEPVIISDSVYVRAEFHPERMEFSHEIIIQPRMAFGTGHHATTSLMMENMLQLDWKNKTVLDMGCGTGILAILASKLGAKDILAIDNDDNAAENTVENALYNHCMNIDALCGDATAIANHKFDIVLANINRNIILSDLDKYAASMNGEATILLSGFYSEDSNAILKCGSIAGLKQLNISVKDNWCCIVMQKNP